MDYMTTDEIDTLAPQVSESPELETTAKRRAYIRQASGMIDGATGRGDRGLEITDIYEEQVRLDQNFAGFLAWSPFWGWLAEEASVYYFGDSEQVYGTLALSDFSVDVVSGVVRNLSQRPSSVRDSGFGGGRAYFESAWSQATLPYHGRVYNQIEENSKPFVMHASYMAGYFVDALVQTSGDVGQSYTIVDSTRGLKKGTEFYFSTDPTLEPEIDKRYITDIDTDSKRIDFRPALRQILPVSAVFRRIDKVVRLACAEIIADLVTYPPNTRSFRKNLGKSDLEKTWLRMNEFEIPVSAAAKLGPYIRF